MLKILASDETLDKAIQIIRYDKDKKEYGSRILLNSYLAILLFYLCTCYKIKLKEYDRLPIEIRNELINTIINQFLNNKYSEA